MKFALAFLLVLLGAASALGYTDTGHQIIAEEAGLLLTGRPAAEQVEALLGGQSMAEVSAWADLIKHSDSPDAGLNRWRDQHSELKNGRYVGAHSTYHYCDIPIEESTYQPTSIGARPDDIVHAMQDCIAILQGREPAIAAFHGLPSRTALILLIHYVGDLAQPLHIGAGYLDAANHWANPNADKAAAQTAGGNYLEWAPGQNLHFFWDEIAVRDAMSLAGLADRPSAYAKMLARDARLTPAPAGNVETWPAQLASAMLPDARRAYEGITILSRDGKYWKIAPPSDEYTAAAARATEENLRAGGVHLAQILNAIWP